MISLTYVIGWSLRASLVALAILLVKQLFREQLSAKWHLHIWAVFYVALVVPPTVLDERFFFRSQSIHDAVDPFAVTGSIGQRTSELITQVLVNPVTTEAAELFSSSGETHQGTVLPVFAGTAPISHPYQSLFLGLYLACALAIFLFFLWSTLKLRLQLRHCNPAGEELAARVRRIKKEMGINRSVKTVYTDVHDSPFVCGLFRPVLAVPSRYAGGEGEHFDDMILIHEMIHLRHHHLLLNYFLTFFRAVHFFNPFLWYVFRRIQNDCELRCDELLLKEVGSREHGEYEELLLTCAAGKKNFIPGTSCLSNGQKNILLRVRRIRGFIRLAEPSSVISWVLTIMLFCMCLSPPSTYAVLEELDTYFGFGVAAFDYNTKQAENYRLSSPLETAYAYGLSLIKYPVTYEWLVASDAERDRRASMKYNTGMREREENGLSTRYNFSGDFANAIESLEERYDVEIDINHITNQLSSGQFSIYNLCRMEDGSYKAVIRCTSLAQKYGGALYYMEDHVVSIRHNGVRYYAEQESMDNYLLTGPELKEIPLPFYGAIYGPESGTASAENASDDVFFTVSYRYDCFTGPMDATRETCVKPEMCRTSRELWTRDESGAFKIASSETTVLGRYPEAFEAIAEVAAGSVGQTVTLELLSVYGIDIGEQIGLLTASSNQDETEGLSGAAEIIGEAMNDLEGGGEYGRSFR